MNGSDWTDRCADQVAVACAFDLLMRNGDDMRHKPFAERKAALKKLLPRGRDGIQYVEHSEAMARRCFRRRASLAWRGLTRRIVPVRRGVPGQDQKDAGPSGVAFRRRRRLDRAGTTGAHLSQGFLVCGHNSARF